MIWFRNYFYVDEYEINEFLEETYFFGILNIKSLQIFAQVFLMLSQQNSNNVLKDIIFLLDCIVGFDKNWEENNILEYE